MCRESPAKPHKCPESVGTFLLKKLFHLMSSVGMTLLFFPVLADRPSHKMTSCSTISIETSVLQLHDKNYLSDSVMNVQLLLAGTFS